MLKWTFAATWLVLVVFALTSFTAYKGVAGPSQTLQSSVAQTLPSHSDEGTTRLIAFVHPFCPCSLATLSNIDLATTRIASPIEVSIVISDLSSNANEVSPAESFSRRFPKWSVSKLSLEEINRRGVATSGHVLLIAKDEQILFSGGITKARGHVGECRGLNELIHAAEQTQNTGSEVRALPVFGCSFATLASHSQEDR